LEESEEKGHTTSSSSLIKIGVLGPPPMMNLCLVLVEGRGVSDIDSHVSEVNNGLRNKIVQEKYLGKKKDFHPQKPFYTPAFH